MISVDQPGAKLARENSERGAGQDRDLHGLSADRWEAWHRGDGCMNTVEKRLNANHLALHDLWRR